MINSIKNFAASASFTGVAGAMGGVTAMGYLKFALSMSPEMSVMPIYPTMTAVFAQGMASVIAMRITDKVMNHVWKEQSTDSNTKKVIRNVTIIALDAAIGVGTAVGLSTALTSAVAFTVPPAMFTAAASVTVLAAEKFLIPSLNEIVNNTLPRMIPD